jgi:hypothetical protein
MADSVTSAPAPAPVSIKNSFTGMMLTFPNAGIHSLVATAFKFRKQLGPRSEAMQQSGWSNEMNVFMQLGLEEVAKNVKRVVYNSGNTTMKETGGKPAPDATNVQLPVAPVGGAAQDETDIETQAADVTVRLQDIFDNNSPKTDNLLMPTQANRTITLDLTGADKNYPQMGQDNCPNEHFRLFVEGLDNFIVQATRLDSRNDNSTISKYEGAMMLSLLDGLFTITKVFGGENNRTDVPNGTLPDDEVNTLFGGAPNQQGTKAPVTGA